MRTLPRHDVVCHQFPRMTGEQVDAQDYDGRTALHVAAACGHLGIMRMLVEQFKAKCHVIDRHGRAPLDDAIFGRHPQAIQYLTQLDCGKTGKLSSERYTEQTIQAAAEDDVTFLKTMAEYGMNINCADYDNRTPLHLAASNSSMHVLRYLVQHSGIHLDPLDHMGHTPLWNAIMNRDMESVSLLRSSGAPVQADISASLCVAAARNDSKFFHLLLKHDIDILSRVRGC